jgi:hypothetical protein
MRTLELIRTLNEKEQRQLRAALSEKKRRSLLVLFDSLKEYLEAEAPDNKTLYEAVYKKRYTKAKDYLLRNELRLLNEEVYRFLVFAAFEKHLNDNNGGYEYWLSRALYDRKNKPLFPVTATEGMKKAESYVANQLTTWPVYSIPLQSMRTLWLMDNVAKTEDSLTEQLTLVEEWMQEGRRRFIYTMMEGQARQRYLQMNLARISNKPVQDRILPDEELFRADVTPWLEKDWYALYINLKRQMYQTKGETRIALLKKMSEVQTRKEFIDVFGYAPEIVNHGNLGIEYIMLGDAVSAAHYFKQAMELNEQYGSIENIAHTQNYVVTLLVQGKYRETLQIYDRYERGIKKSRAADLMQIYKAYAYLFLNDADKALESLPEPTQTMTYPNALKMRYVYVIAFILRGEFALAANELGNLRRFMKLNGDKSAQQPEIGELFQLYLNEVMGKSKTGKAETAADKLRAQLPKYTHWALVDLHLCWLMKKLKVG